MDVQKQFQKTPAYNSATKRMEIVVQGPEKRDTLTKRLYFFPGYFVPRETYIKDIADKTSFSLVDVDEYDVSALTPLKRPQTRTDPFVYGRFIPSSKRNMALESSSANDCTPGLTCENDLAYRPMLGREQTPQSNQSQTDTDIDSSYLIQPASSTVVTTDDVPKIVENSKTIDTEKAVVEIESKDRFTEEDLILLREGKLCFWWYVFIIHAVTPFGKWYVTKERYIFSE